MERKKLDEECIKLIDNLYNVIDDFKKKTGFCPMIDMDYQSHTGTAEPQGILFSLKGLGRVFG